MRGDRAVVARLAEHRPCDLSMAAITLGEILYGIRKSPHKKLERTKKLALIQSQIEILPFGAEAADHYAIIRNELERNGVPISERDIQIASIALAYGLCLVSHNTAEFARIRQLKLEDWH